MKQCSSDARSEGQHGHSSKEKYKELEGPRSTAAVKGSSRPAWLGIELEKKIRMDTRSG
jgi:hypothetical protein